MCLSSMGALAQIQITRSSVYVYIIAYNCLFRKGAIINNNTIIFIIESFFVREK